MTTVAWIIQGSTRPFAFTTTFLMCSVVSCPGRGQGAATSSKVSSFPATLPSAKVAPVFDVRTASLKPSGESEFVTAVFT